MKKALFAICILTAASIFYLLLGGGYAFADSDLELKIDGVRTKYLYAGTAEINLDAVVTATESAALFCAIYEGDFLTDILSVTKTLTQTDGKITLSDVTVTEAATKLEIFVWNTQSLAPIVPPAVITEEPFGITDLTAKIGNRTYTARIDEKNNSIALNVPIYYINGNTSTLEIPSSNSSYSGTPTAAQYEASIKSLTPQITLSAEATLVGAYNNLDLTMPQTITVRNNDGSMRDYVLTVDAMTVQKDNDFSKNTELVSPITKTYNAGANLLRHNAPLGGSIIGSGVWEMGNFAFSSLGQSSYNAQSDRTEDTPGYNTQTAAGLKMTKDRGGQIYLYHREGNAPKNNIAKTVSKAVFTVEAMSGDGMEIYFGENGAVVRVVPNNDGSTCRLFLGKEDTRCDIDVGIQYELECVTQSMGGNNMRNMLYVDGQWVYTADAPISKIYRLNRFHVKFVLLENTRAQVLLKQWSISYKVGAADIGKLYFAAGAVASSDDGHGAKNVLDRDYNTRWSSQDRGAYLTIELDRVVPIAYLGIAFYMGNERSYTVSVQVSENGQDYNEVVTKWSSEQTKEMQALSLGGIYSAKYVRILCFGNTKNEWNSLTEVSVYGAYTDGSMPVATDGPRNTYGLSILTNEQISAFNEFDKLFERMYLWIANLYDHETGGFYMAKSGADDPAQDTALEMSSFAFSAIMGNSDCWNDLPESVKQKFVDFIKERQDPVSGLFIDTQGPTNDRETARNQSCIMGWVNRWSIDLLYRHPSQSSAAESRQLAIGTQAVATSVTLPSYLATTQTYRNWIESWNWETNSWTAGDQVGNSIVYLRYMDTASYEAYKKVLLDWLAERQFDDTGLWAPTIDFNSISGAFKVGGVYATLGEKIPNAKKVMESTLTCMWTDTPTVAHYVRNPISVLRQIAAYGPEYEDAIQAAIVENMDTVISWFDIFLCPDGGFSQYEKKSMRSFGGIQGSHQLWEGDIDSAVMILTARREMYGLMGIGVPPIAAGEDFWNWFTGETEVPSPYIDPKYDNANIDSFNSEQLFEGIAAGTVLKGTELGGNSINETMAAKIVKDSEKNSNVLELSYAAGLQHTGGGGPSFYMGLGNDVTQVRYVPTLTNQTVTVECDIKFSGCTATNNFFVVYGLDGYMLSFGGNGNQKLGIRINPSDINYGGTIGTLTAGAWHKLKIEYTKGGSSAEFVCRIYLNDALLSTNSHFYGYGNGTPNEAYGRFGVVWYRAGRGTLYLDNIKTRLSS